MTLTHEQKINYMRIATNLCRYGFSNEQIDLIVTLYEAVLEKGGDLTMSDTFDIEQAAKKRADNKAKSELLDKVSTKVKKK